MNVNETRIQRPDPMVAAPATPSADGEGARPRSPAEVLAILEPTRDEPAPIMLSGLWRTGSLPEPQGV